MKTGAFQTFSIGLVRPVKARVFKATIRATDRAWRTAIFGMGGSNKRIAGARIGVVDGQPLAVIAELQSECAHGTPVWTIETEAGLWAFIGPAAIYNDAGFGPATLGITRDRLAEIVKFNPDPVALQEGLQRTIESRSKPDGPA
jgi:hypothetical protein